MVKAYSGKISDIILGKLKKNKSDKSCSMSDLVLCWDCQEIRKEILPSKEYEFPVAAITKQHKYNGLKQHIFIPFWV